MTYSLISLVALSSLTLASPAISQDATESMASSDWTRTNYVVAVSDSQGINVEQVVAQNMSEDGSPLAGSLGFACTNNKLFVMLSYDDVDMSSAIEAAWKEDRAKPRAGTLYVDGTSGDRSGFMDMRDSKVYMSMTPGDRRTLYNGVIRGQDLSTRIRGNRQDLHVPAVNDDFRQFGAECGLGTLSRDAE